MTRIVARTALSGKKRPLFLRSVFGISLALLGVFLLRSRRPDVDAVLASLRTYDSEIGRVLFQNNCVNCHTGWAPRLRRVVRFARSNQSGARYIIESMIYPEAVVAPDTQVDKWGRVSVMPYLNLSAEQVGCITKYMIDQFVD